MVLVTHNQLGTKESIETASFFMISNQIQAQECVELWADQIKLSLPSRKLFYLYVANDVLQKCRRSDYPQEFAKVMPSTLQAVFSHTG
jgi:CID domain